jgi:hypothetical protein
MLFVGPKVFSVVEGGRFSNTFSFYFCREIKLHFHPEKVGICRVALRKVRVAAVGALPREDRWHDFAFDEFRQPYDEQDVVANLVPGMIS